MKNEVKAQINEYIEYLLDNSSAEKPMWNKELVLSGKANKWNYIDGCMITALLSLYEMTGRERYFEFAKDFIDYFVQEDGTIRTYDVTEYNLDNINTASNLFFLYDKTGEEKYRLALDHVRTQLDTMPRTKEGSFWHKDIYPNQVWLDGLYNRDYKIGGKNVTYQPAVTKASLHAIGSNLTQKFKVVMPSMEMTLNPSYNIGDDEPDNTLILKLAGDGSAKKMTGYVTGDVGCGCYAYGHTSPTRIVYWPWVSSRYVSCYGRWFYPCVVDIAPTYGRFVMKFRERGCGPVELTDEDLDEDDGL